MRQTCRTMALLLALLSALVSGAAQALARKAFIVGNGTYAHAPQLPNTLNDARDLADRLRAMGYTVELGLDLTRSQLLASFQAFVRSLAADDVALLYFAGHALQIGGENYLFPVDVRLASEDDARQRLVPLNALLSDLSRTTRTRVVILDACRNNPFEAAIQGAQATRSLGASRGLARVYAGVGTFVAYATQPGNVALDGAGRNSPFTAALLRHMVAPGADIHAVMRRVRADVQRETSEQQIPWENSSLIEEVVLGVERGVPTAAQPGPTASPAPRPASPPPASRPRPEPVSLSYVTGLDPQGDNFLALRDGPTADARRIATMGPDTLLKVVESRGVWRRVELLDGTGGWAHSNWIACCRIHQPLAGAAAPLQPSAQPPIAQPPLPSTPAQPPGPPAAVGTCDDLWHQRNAIWHRHGFCFQTERGKRAFGNAGCSRDQAAARAAMTPAERAEIDALIERERRAGCS